MQRGSSKLHSHFVRYLIEWNKIWCILVLHRHAKAHILHTHFAKFLQGGIASLITIIQTSNLVVRFLQALNRDAYSYLRELLTEIDNPIRKETIR